MSCFGSLFEEKTATIGNIVFGKIWRYIAVFITQTVNAPVFLRLHARL